MIRRLMPTRAEAEALVDMAALAFPGRVTRWSAEDYIHWAAQGALFADRSLMRGYLVLGRAADEGEILDLGVAPDARRQGVASALIDAAMTHGRDEGVSRLFLEVAGDNCPAQALYTAMGFVEVGLRRGYYRRPDGSRVDARVLAREL